MQEISLDKAFHQKDFTQDPLQKGEYENCTFHQCDFSGSDLSHVKFIDCVFKSCNLSLAKLNETTFQSVNFKDCKMLGLRFDTCNEFGLSLSFDQCQLNHSSFFKLKIKKSIFRNSQMEEIDFAETDLSGSVFDNCDLLQSIFENSLLEKADFRTAYNYSFDPEKNRIKKARFSISGISGLLNKYNIIIE